MEKNIKMKDIKELGERLENCKECAGEKNPGDDRV